jgi:acyl-CoA synthetase (AMP-forming)/AMP-acid ligase II
MIAGSYFNWPVKRWPNKIAAICQDERLTFAQIDERINRLANGLRSLGLKKPKRIGVLLPNSPRFIEVRFALQKAGLTLVRLNVRQSLQEHAYILNHSRSHAFIYGEDFLATARELKKMVPGIKTWIFVPGGQKRDVSYEDLISASSPAVPEIEVSPDDVDRINYTSGTTGRPKGVLMTFGAAQARLRNDFLNEEILITHEDVYLAVAPLTHAGGVVLIPYYIKGATTVIMPSFDPGKILETIERERVTSTLLIPTMIIKMIEHPDVHKYDLRSLKRIFYGTAPMPVEKLRKAIEIFGNIFRQNYGLTEATQPVMYLSPEDHILSGPEHVVARLGSCGRPALGLEVRVVNERDHLVKPGEVGEIIVRGDSIMKGYLRQSKATAEALRGGWLRTGDLATVDEEGYVFIVDRKSDMIISGGFNIYPKEIEEVIYQYPGVSEVAVIGVPDDLWGESAKAIVVPKEGASLTEEGIIEFCRQHLASYKKPKSVDFIKELPKNNNGKILKRELKARYWQGQARMVH